MLAETVAVIAVEGIPAPQPRPRAYARPTGHAGVYDPKTADVWKTQVVIAARRKRPRQPLQGAVHVTAEFFLPRPLRLSRRADPDGPMLCAAKCDVDNLTKAILDCLTRDGWWRDDRQVASMLAVKWWAAKHAPSGALIKIGRIDPARLETVTNGVRR